MVKKVTCLFHFINFEIEITNVNSRYRVTIFVLLYELLFLLKNSNQALKNKTYINISVLAENIFSLLLLLLKQPLQQLILCQTVVGKIAERKAIYPKE